MSENHPIEENNVTDEPTDDLEIVEAGEEILDGDAPDAPEYVVLPSVVIIGRPNVGKSTLFNKLTNTRKAIVGDEPGITRDRHYGVVEWQNYAFEIVDTGGIVPDEEAVIPSNIFKQAGYAIDSADLLLWVVDARAGATQLDEEIAGHLRATGKTVYVVANKAESQAVSIAAQEFHRFGFAAVYPVSAEHGTGAAELLDDAMKFVNAPPAILPQKRNIRVAIIGRPNVGKSSLVNRLLGQERVIVSPIAGTTRDAIDTELIHDGTEFTLIDTAGIRRKGKTFEMSEKLSVVMARKALERADVAFLLLDSIEGPTNLDATIAGYALESGTSIILGLNKWDIVEKDSTTMSLYERQLRERIKFLDYAPTVFISALTGQRVTNLLDLAKQAYAARHRRIATGELNRFFEQNLENPRASTPTNARVKIHYVTQARNVPPTFVLFTNSPKPLHFSYTRYVENRLRESFDFFGTPIRIVQKLKLKPKGK